MCEGGGERKLGNKAGTQNGEGTLKKKGLGLEANLGPQHHFAFAVQSPVLLGIKSLFGKSGSANI